MSETQTKSPLGSHGPFKRWLQVGVAFVLGLFAVYTVVVVVIAVSSGKPHAGVFWPTVVLMLVLAGWFARCAMRLFHRSSGRG